MKQLFVKTISNNDCLPAYVKTNSFSFRPKEHSFKSSSSSYDIYSAPITNWRKNMGAEQ